MASSILCECLSSICDAVDPVGVGKVVAVLVVGHRGGRTWWSGGMMVAGWSWVVEVMG